MIEKVPAFALQNQDNIEISSESLLGKYLVLYFYPKDSTPGCTTEGQEFRDSYKQFKKMNNK